MVPLRSCPDRAELRAYISDPSDGPRQEAVACHLDACEVCRQFLMGVDAHASLLAEVRNLGSAPPGGRVPAQLVTRAKALWSIATVNSAGVPALPGYSELHPIGQGSAARVYRARRDTDGRTVALKLLHLAVSAPGLPDRFWGEAAAAGLAHPNIVQTFAHGIHEGSAFLVLEFCAGGTLADRIGGSPWAPGAAAELVAALAGAVEAAHAGGVIHRDLKPANVLFGTADGGAAEVPKIADFGLAKWSNRTALTSSFSVLGTPGYLAPEQADGRSHSVGPAADVYALGAILYELLTGRPPFVGEHPAEVLLQVLYDDPPAPAALRPGLDRDLATVCERCLQKNPAKRYGSAAALAADLRRFLAGNPVLARPVGRLEALGRRVRRYPARAAGVALAALCAVGLAAEAVRHQQTLAEVRAEEMVRTLDTADTRRVPEQIARIEPHRGRALPHLRARAAEPIDTRPGLHARLALVGLGEEPPGELLDHLDRFTPEELGAVREALRPHASEAAERCWGWAAPGTAPALRLRAAYLLAAFAPGDARWANTAPALATALAAEGPLRLGYWVDGLRPVREPLLPALLARFRAGPSGDERVVVFAALSELATDQLDVLVGALLEADAREFGALFPAVARFGPLAVERLTAELAARQGPSDAARRANAAVGLTRLGSGRAAHPVWRAAPDPTAQSLAIARARAAGTDPRALVELYRDERNPGVRRALALALGEYPPEAVPGGVAEQFLDRCAATADAGEHAALCWALDRWGHGAAARERVRALAGKPQGDRGWIVARHGQTFAIVRAGEFAMGSPPNEPGRNPDEQLHTRVVPRTFAIATTEVTAEQYAAFARATGRDSAVGLRGAPRGPDYPAHGVTWFDAAAYCRWLSELDGVGEDQRCFPDIKQIKSGMKLPPDYLRRHGYRLPTEAEWEMACRAGTTAPGYWGTADELLARYAWVLTNADNRPQPVARLRPNPLGLFDAIGNDWEWCMNGKSPYPADRATDTEAPLLEVGPEQRALRGAAFPQPPWSARAAHRAFNAPHLADESISFRVAFTLP